MTTKKKVLEFANKVSGKKMGSKFAIKTTDPEYRILATIVSDEMAEVALCLKINTPMSAEEVAPLCGKSLEETKKLLWDLAVAGVCMVNEKEGVDKYWYATWVP